MPSCTPGDIQQISYSTDDLNNAIVQTNVNKDRIVDHENRLTANESNIGKNSAEIEALKSEVQNDTSGIAVLHGKVSINEAAIATINTELTTNYAKINGDSAQIFKVADPTAPSNAINKAWADAAYQPTGYSYSKIESDGKYALGSDTYSKSEVYTRVEADTKYATLTNTYTKAEVDALIATVNATIASHHP